MFGNCAHTVSMDPTNNIGNSEYVRHSVHLVSGAIQQWHQSAAQSLDTGLTSTVSCSFMHTTSSRTSSYSLKSISPVACNGQVPPALPPKQRKQVK